MTHRARALALQLAAEARAEWGFATEIMARAFRQDRQLASSERRQVAETVYGLVRGERRLAAIVDELLVRARRQVSTVARQELKLIVYELRNGLPAEALKAEVRRLAGGELNLASAIADDAGLDGHAGLDREALRLSYPTWLLERLVASQGEGNATELASAMNVRGPLCVRANTVKMARAELIHRLAQEGVTATPTQLSPVGLVFETRVNAFGLSAFREGLFEVMDEGSQLVAEATAPPPRGKVVDACAGAGGKTLALAALLANQGRILALDDNGKKLEELRRRARRAGLSNLVARQVTGAVLPAEAKLGSWDRVLVDAPCSGSGTLRRNPEAPLAPHPETARPLSRRADGPAPDLRPLGGQGRAPRLRHLLRPARGERRRGGALPPRAIRFRSPAPQGDLGQRPGGAFRRRNLPAASAPYQRH